MLAMAGAVTPEDITRPPTPTELADLLLRAGKGEEEAWRTILRLYARRVFALAKSRCRRDDLAEEVAQSVFATVAAQLGAGLYAEQGRFEAWLFRVAMNRTRDEMRRLARHPEPTDPASLAELSLAAPAPPSARREELASDPNLAALRLALETLGDADRQVVELRHHAGMSFRHIAAMLDEPLGTVLARHHRALKKLKDLISRARPGGSGTGS